MNNLFKKGFACLVLASAMASNVFGSGDKMDVWIDSITKKEPYMIIGSNGSDDNGSVAVIGFSLKPQDGELIVFASADDEGGGNSDGNTTAQMSFKIADPHKLDIELLTASNAKFNDGNVVANNGEDANSYNAGADDGNNVNATIAANNANYGTTEKAPNADDSGNGNVATNNDKDVNSYNAGANDGSNVNTTIAANNANYGTTNSNTNFGNGNVNDNNGKDAKDNSDNGSANDTGSNISFAESFSAGINKYANNTIENGKDVKGNEESKDVADNTAYVNNLKIDSFAYTVSSKIATNYVNYGAIEIVANNNKGSKGNTDSSSVGENEVNTNDVNYGATEVVANNVNVDTDKNSNGEYDSTDNNINEYIAASTVVAYGDLDTNNGVKSGDNVPASSEQAA